jgi:hypothetical protein
MLSDVQIDVQDLLLRVIHTTPFASQLCPYRFGVVSSLPTRIE